MQHDVKIVGEEYWQELLQLSSRLLRILSKTSTYCDVNTPFLLFPGCSPPFQNMAALIPPFPR